MVIAKQQFIVVDKNALHPYRTGFCDGLFNRECKSPWSTEGWGGIKKNAAYLDGYMRGEEIRRERGDARVAGYLPKAVQGRANEHNID